MLSRHADWQRVEVGLIRCVAVKARMWTAAIIEVEVTADRVPRLANAFVGPQIYLLVFDAAPQPLDEHVSRHAPLPSMLIAMPSLASALVKAAPVNCEPWSVLKISGLP